jgi:hypothetical protein
MEQEPAQVEREGGREEGGRRPCGKTVGEGEEEKGGWRALSTEIAACWCSI